MVDGVDEVDRVDLVDGVDAVMACVVGVLLELRLNPLGDEYVLQDVIGEALARAGVGFSREVRLGRGARVDFLVDGGVVIEVKNGKPNGRALGEQVARYCGFDVVRGVVVVVSRSAWGVEAEVDGKPVSYVALNRNWGVSF